MLQQADAMAEVLCLRHVASQALMAASTILNQKTQAVVKATFEAASNT